MVESGLDSARVLAYAAGMMAVGVAETTKAGRRAIEKVKALVMIQRMNPFVVDESV